MDETPTSKILAKLRRNCRPSVPAIEAVRTDGVARKRTRCAVAIAGWIVPGLGHVLLGRWGRALAFFVAVGGLAITGYLMRGNVFPPHSDDPFGTVGFLADAASGVFYFLAHFVEAAGPDIARAAGDYGTRFIAAAGVVNVLACLMRTKLRAGGGAERCSRACELQAEPLRRDAAFRAARVRGARHASCSIRHAGRIRYAIWSFALFIVIGVGFAWLMYPFSR